MYVCKFNKKHIVLLKLLKYNNIIILFTASVSTHEKFKTKIVKEFYGPFLLLQYSYPMQITNKEYINNIFLFLGL